MIFKDVSNQNITVGTLKALLGSFDDNDEIIIHDIIKEKSIKVNGFVSYGTIDHPMLALTAKFDEYVDIEGSTTIEKHS